MASDEFNTGVSNVNSANSQGQSAIGSFDPNAWKSNTQSGLDKITSSQASGNEDLVNAFKTQIASQPSNTAAYTTANTMFNVPGLQNMANTLNNTILNTPNSNLNAARGFNFDQNQIDQKTSQDLQRLAPAAAAATTNANTASTNAGNYVTAQMNQNQMNMTPLQVKQQAQADLYARQYSGFTATAEAQLTALQQKMQSGVQLSTAEMAAYQGLTSSEQQYKSSIASNQAAIEQANIGNQYKIVGNNLVNTQNGQAVNPAMLTAKTGIANNI